MPLGLAEFCRGGTISLRVLILEPIDWHR